MSFKDRFASTSIRKGKINQLSISLDDNHGFPQPVFLYIPYAPEPEHNHIELDRKQARKLWAWLSEYLMTDEEILELKLKQERRPKE